MARGQGSGTETSGGRAARAPAIASPGPPSARVLFPLALALAMAAAGCAASGGDADSVGRSGGILRIVGSSDVEHLDTASANSVGAHALNHMYARTLFGMMSSNDFTETVPLRVDVASAMPARDNGGISGDGLTYTIRLRGDVLWNTRPARPVTAADFARGLKRLCNPAAPSGGRAYYISTIQGMDAYCRGFAGVDARSAAAIADYQHRHEISGIAAPDPRTLVFRLNRPASDFLQLLALRFTAAAPEEYDRYVPDGPRFRANTISNGPYQITEYIPGRSYVLTRNPAWRRATDPLRGDNVAQIKILLGQDSPDTVQQMLEQGAADLAWDQPVPTPAIARLRRDRDPGFAIRETPSSSPYLVFNTLSPANDGALGKRRVRQAIQYAIDRTALIKIYGGPDVAEPMHTVIPPGSAGYRAYNRYPTPGDAGDPARCRALLAEAGYPDGLTLKFPYRTNSHHKRVAESIKENLRGCGIDAELDADTNGNFYGRSLVTPAKAREGAWDIAAPGWTPDWYGNNGRSIIQPLFDGRGYGQNSTDYGGYHDPKVNALIDAALTAPDPARAGELWRRADREIMEDAAIVPLLNRAFAVYHSTRVRNAQFVPTASAYDYSRLSLSAG